MAHIKPLRALVYGLGAGAIGSLVQDLFFKATARVAPAAPRDAFQPRETEDLAERPGLDERNKEESRHIVHYAFGSAWGGAYGIVRESLPFVANVGGAVVWSTLVWTASDNLVLPTFRLAAWPKAYPWKIHAYAWAAHVAYGLALVGAYEALRARPLLLGLTALRIRRGVRALPGPARKPARRAAWQALAFGRRLPDLVEERVG